MSDPTAELFGLELFFSSIENQFTSKQDALVAFVHFIVVRNRFKCVGRGDQFEQEIDWNSGSERLPVDWNADQQTYLFRYVQASTKKTLVLKVIRSDSDLLVNALLCPQERVAACTLNTNEYISDRFNSFGTLFVNQAAQSRLLGELNKEMVSKLFAESNPSGNKNDQSTRDRNQNRNDSPPPNRHEPPTAHPRLDPYPMPLNRPVPELGGADLDPLGRGLGGGMLMDPRQFEQIRIPRPGFNPYGPGFPRFDPSSGLDRNLPPGAVPPGARFDYIGPPRQRRPPNNFGPGSHPDLERPSDYDDMFM